MLDTLLTDKEKTRRYCKSHERSEEILRKMTTLVILVDRTRKSRLKFFGQETLKEKGNRKTLF